jgi:hypothetical protein
VTSQEQLQQLVRAAHKLCADVAAQSPYVDSRSRPKQLELDEWAATVAKVVAHVAKVNAYVAKKMRNSNSNSSNPWPQHTSSNSSSNSNSSSSDPKRGHPSSTQPDGQHKRQRHG